jgi:hypothetical protein
VNRENISLKIEEVERTNTTRVTVFVHPSTMQEAHCPFQLIVSTLVEPKHCVLHVALIVRESLPTWRNIYVIGRSVEVSKCRKEVHARTAMGKTELICSFSDRCVRQYLQSVRQIMQKPLNAVQCHPKHIRVPIHHKR